MKNSKMLCAVLLAATMQTKTENLNGSTRNLNVSPLTKHSWLQLSTNKNDSKNILRDLACNCDDPDFEIVAEIRVKPIAIVHDIGAIGQFTDDPAAQTILLISYLEKMTTDIDKNRENFIDHNLKEMLFSPDQDGKTAYDILEEKQSTGKPGCAMLKEGFEAIKELLEAREHEKKSKQIEAELEKSQQ